MTNIHRNVHISGRIQGVFFRQSAKVMAERLGLTGTIRNGEDGSLRIEVEGQEQRVAQFLAWCRKGMVYARIEQIDEEDGMFVGYRSFDATL